MTWLCLSSGLCGPMVVWPLLGLLELSFQSERLHFQQSPSISKAIFTYLRQRELRVGGQIISLLFLQ